MPDIQKTITDAIGGFFGSPIVQLSLRAIAVYFVIIWLVTAYWAFRDTQLRTSNPVAPYLSAAFIIAFTPVFFLFAALIYKIVRPQERIGEAYERGLAEEALLAEIEAVEHCATCSRKVHEEWIICPTCRTRLKRVCPNCNKLVGLEWSLCAWCGRDFERPIAAIGTVPAPVAEDGTPLLGRETVATRAAKAMRAAAGVARPPSGS
jgi:hypothetical protein